MNMKERPTTLHARPSRRDLVPLAGLAALAALPAAARARPASQIKLRDRMEIVDLFARYSWYYDCSDAEAYASLFTEDGVIEAFGSEAARGRTAIAAFIRTLFAQRGDEIWQHHTDHLVYFGRGTAYTVYSYWSLLRGGGGNYGVMSLGYYVSDCVRIEGHWLFKRRAIHRWDSSRLPWAAASPR